jgi:hypothetical protein
MTAMICDVCTKMVTFPVYVVEVLKETGEDFIVYKHPGRQAICHDACESNLREKWTKEEVDNR